MSDVLHIVCLDAPAPPHYGGAIDMFYKIIALAQSGKKIILHFFDYHPERSAAGLESFCSEIHAYKRKSLASAFTLLPYTVESRIQQGLIQRLNADNHPILLEGIHCTGIIPQLHQPERVVVRLHNDEAMYYKRLAATEGRMFQKIYDVVESKRLLKYYRSLREYRVQFACLSKEDMDVFENLHHFDRLHFIPGFIPWTTVASPKGKGSFCLYHGNMRVPENAAAARWLVDEVFARMKVPFVIAGSGIPKQLMDHSSRHPHIRIVNDPSPEVLEGLITDAHIHVLPSMNQTGVKLKLLHALFCGRFCVTNKAGVAGSELETAVTMAGGPGSFRAAIDKLMQQEFTEEDKKNRQPLLTVYDHVKNAKRLSALWSHCQ